MYMTSTLEAELDKVSERVSISDNEKFYVVKDDPRIEGGKATDFHRVSTMLSVIEKPALRKWMMNIALDYVKENLQMALATLQFLLTCALLLRHGTSGQVLWIWK